LGGNGYIERFMSMNELDQSITKEKIIEMIKNIEDINSISPKDIILRE